MEVFKQWRSRQVSRHLHHRVIFGADSRGVIQNLKIGPESIETGMRFPHLLAGLIGVSGFVHRPESLLAEAQPHAKTHPFLLTHGSFDAVIPHSPVEKQVDRLAEAGIRCQWKVFPKEHTIYGEVELQLYREFLEEIRAGLQPAEG